MRFVTSNIHGIFDYLFAALLIAMPWLLGVAQIGGPETLVPITVGVGVILYSLITDYEWGIFPWIPLRVHLIFDILAGGTLIVSVIFFGFYQYVLWFPYVAIGLLGIAAALLTQRTPGSSRPRFTVPESMHRSAEYYWRRDRQIPGERPGR